MAQSATDGTAEEQNEFEQAVECVRDHYGDSYQDRIELGANLNRWGHENYEPVDEDDEYPAEVASEGMLQQLVRYQDQPAEEVHIWMQNRYPEKADAMKRALIGFAQDGAGQA